MQRDDNTNVKIISKSVSNVNEHLIYLIGLNLHNNVKEYHTYYI